MNRSSRKVSDEVKKKISESMKGRVLSDEHKEKISLSMKGKVKSDSHKKRISESMKKYWSTIPYENNESNMEEYEQEVN